GRGFWGRHFPHAPGYTPLGADRMAKRSARVQLSWAAFRVWALNPMLNSASKRARNDESNEDTSASRPGTAIWVALTPRWLPSSVKSGAAGNLLIWPLLPWP